MDNEVRKSNNSRGGRGTGNTVSHGNQANATGKSLVMLEVRGSLYNLVYLYPLWQIALYDQKLEWNFNKNMKKDFYNFSMFSE